MAGLHDGDGGSDGDEHDGDGDGRGDGDEHDGDGDEGVGLGWTTFRNDLLSKKHGKNYPVSY